MEILTNNDKTIVARRIEDNDYLIKINKEYYKIDKENFDNIRRDEKLNVDRVIKENPAWAIVMSLTIMATIISYLFHDKYVIIDENFLYANIVLFINIFIHESGHIMMLRLLYGKGKVQVGFKFYFIYPAFYVDTSESYFLPKYKRIAVYLAGNFMNCIYILITTIFVPWITKYNYAVISTILINFFPIIKSDGYYAFISLFDRYNFHKSKTQNFIEDTIRGLIMFVFLYGLSKLQINF